LQTQHKPVRTRGPDLHALTSSRLIACATVYDSAEVASLQFHLERTSMCVLPYGRSGNTSLDFWFGVPLEHVPLLEALIT